VADSVRSEGSALLHLSLVGSRQAIMALASLVKLMDRFAWDDCPLSDHVVLDPQEKARSLCCPKDTPFHDCTWRGDRGTCTNNVCQTQEVLVQYDKWDRLLHAVLKVCRNDDEG
jgi:hypothetical protein